MTASKLYEIAEGAQIPADWREDLERELDFAAAADTLADAAAQALDQAREARILALAAESAAQDRLDLAERAQHAADRRVGRILTDAGLARTARGIMTRAEAQAAAARRSIEDRAGTLEDIGLVHPAWRDDHSAAEDAAARAEAKMSETP
jgi:hypothetical protein